MTNKFDWKVFASAADPVKYVACVNPDCAVAMFDMLKSDACPACWTTPIYKVSILDWGIAPISDAF